VFLRNLKTNVTELISVSVDGQSSGKNESNIPFPWNKRNDSDFPSVSEDGRYVVFQSMATNLVTGVSYTPSDFEVSNVFARDLITKNTTLISISPNGTQASNSYCSTQTLSGGRNISEDGKNIVFYCRASNLTNTSLSGGSLENIYLRDLSSPTPALISIGVGGAAPNGVSGMPVISADGNYIAFSSNATNLTNPGLSYLFGSNIFRWTRATNAMEVVSSSTNGTTGANFKTEYPVISNDGQVVSYSGNATNLTASPSVPQTGDEQQNSIFRWDATTRRNLLATQSNDMSLGYAQPEFSMSANGKTIVFSRSSNGLSRGLGFINY
jgi:WD40-like Beta Propeller Repeat